VVTEASTGESLRRPGRSELGHHGGSLAGLCSDERVDIVEPAEQAGATVTRDAARVGSGPGTGRVRFEPCVDGAEFGRGELGQSHNEEAMLFPQASGTPGRVLRLVPAAEVVPRFAEPVEAGDVREGMAADEVGGQDGLDREVTTSGSLMWRVVRSAQRNNAERLSAPLRRHI
jgi:hypothetical protein